MLETPLMGYTPKHSLRLPGITYSLAISALTLKFIFKPTKEHFAQR
jgi:hypothetical protein